MNCTTYLSDAVISNIHFGVNQRAKTIRTTVQCGYAFEWDFIRVCGRSFRCNSNLNQSGIEYMLAFNYTSLLMHFLV